METVSAHTFYLFTVLSVIGFLVAPSLTVYLRSWEECFGGWYSASVGSALFISAAIVIVLEVA